MGWEREVGVPVRGGLEEWDWSTASSLSAAFSFLQITKCARLMTWKRFETRKRRRVEKSLKEKKKESQEEKQEERRANKRYGKRKE